jgi:hypothetical protein
MSLVIEPTSEMEEVAQNVRTLLSTPRGSVPMDRALGIVGSWLDAPTEAAKAAMTSDILDTLTLYEPRIDVVSISYEHDDLTGRLSPRVVFRLRSGGETASV